MSRSVPKSQDQQSSVARSQSVPHPHAGASAVSQQAPLAPFLQSEHAKYVYPEIVALVRKVNELDKQFGAKDAKLKQDAEALEKHHEEELRSIQAMKEKGEIEIGSQWEIHKYRMKWEKDNLQNEKREFEEMKARSAAANFRQEKVTLDVGGTKFKTEVRTLTSNPDSLLHEMAKLSLEAKLPGEDAKIFIDRDPRHFRLILNFLRQGKEVLLGSDLRGADQRDLHEILCEAKFYKLSDLQQLIERRMVALEKPLQFSDLCPTILMLVPSHGQPHPPKYKHATKQGVQLEKKNLTGIVMERVHFKHPSSFEGSVLIGATFRQCCFDAAINFTNADLHKAKFDHCEGLVLSERFLLTGANMEETIFDPPLDED